MDKELVNFINNHADSIDANEFDWLFAAAPTAGISTCTLMQVLMDAKVEPLKYMLKVRPRMFYNYYSAEPLVVPGNIEVIEMNGFADCQCREIILEEGIEQIHSAAFKDATYLEKITLPSTLRLLGSWLFYHCYNLKEIVYKGSREDLLKLSGGKQNACFVSSSCISEYKAKVICADGELTLSEVQR